MLGCFDRCVGPDILDACMPLWGLVQAGLPYDRDFVLCKHDHHAHFLVASVANYEFSWNVGRERSKMVPGFRPHPPYVDYCLWVGLHRHGTWEIALVDLGPRNVPILHDCKLLGIAIHSKIGWNSSTRISLWRRGMERVARNHRLRLRRTRPCLRWSLLLTLLDRREMLAQERQRGLRDRGGRQSNRHQLSMIRT